MQKFLWYLAICIPIFGFYFAYGHLGSTPCTYRAMQHYVHTELGAKTLVQNHDPAVVRALQIRYIRKNNCDLEDIKDENT